MFNSHQFFMERLTKHIQHLSRYLRYMLNGHITIALLFLIVALSYYYQLWLESLPTNFPVAWIVAIIFGALAIHNPIRSLLQEPDLVFLIAAEKNMVKYFRNAIVYSFVAHIYLIFIVAAALGPMYFHFFTERSGKIYLLTILLLFVLKFWNLLANWWMLTVHSKGAVIGHMILRFILSTAIVLFFIQENKKILIICTTGFIALLSLTYVDYRKRRGIPWQTLVESDEQRLQSFYRLANLFTDVPHIKSPIKKRKWLVYLVQRLTVHERKYTYDYLYRLTFFRSGDYLGMYLRLLVIGSIAIIFVDNMWIKISFIILFLYLSSFQMVALYKHHRTIMWLDLYPVSLKERRRALMSWLYVLSLGKTIILSLVFLWSTGDFLGLVVAIISGILFTVLFMNSYVKNKIKEN